MIRRWLKRRQAAIVNEAMTGECRRCGHQMHLHYEDGCLADINRPTRYYDTYKHCCPCKVDGGRGPHEHAN